MTWNRRAIARSWVVLLPLVVGLWLLLQRQRDEQQGLERAIREARLERERLVAETERLPSGRPEGATLSPDRKPTPSPSPKSERQKGFIERDVFGDPELGRAVARRHRRYAPGDGAHARFAQGAHPRRRLLEARRHCAPRNALKG